MSLKSQGLLTEKIATPTTTVNSLSPTIKWWGNPNFCLIFKGSYLKQRNETFTSPNRINIFIVYKLDTWPHDSNSDFTLND